MAAWCLNFLKFRVKKSFFLWYSVKEIGKAAAFFAFFERFGVSRFFRKNEIAEKLFQKKVSGEGTVEEDRHGVCGAADAGSDAGAGFGFAQQR